MQITSSEIDFANLAKKCATELLDCLTHKKEPLR